MIVKLLTEHHLEFLSLKGGCTTPLSLHMSKCHIVGILMPRLKLALNSGRYDGFLFYVIISSPDFLSRYLFP